MAIFINHTNHPSARWSAAQRAAAEGYGEIVDLPFPDIAPDWDEAAVARLLTRSKRRRSGRDRHGLSLVVNS